MSTVSSQTAPRMNPEIKAKWVAALRSGSFEQGRDRLRMVDLAGGPDRFCCLGVLCYLAVQEGVLSTGQQCDDGVIEYGGEIAILPEVVQEWAGLTESFQNPNNPAVQSEHGWNCLSVLNDKAVPFSKIADLIEDQL